MGKRALTKRVKTANGAGSVSFNATTKRWQGRYTTTDPETGESVRKSVYGHSEQECRAKLVAALNAKNDGTLTVTKGRQPSVSDYAATWLAAREGRIRPRSLGRYAEIVKRHVEPAIGRVQLRALTPQQVDRLMTGMVKTGSSPRTANYARQTLRAMLNAAMRDGLVGRNVAALASPMPERQERVKTLTPAEVKAMLRAAEVNADGALWITALSTGCRFSELAGLEWSAVDLDARLMRVDRVVQWDEHARAFVTHPPKTALSRREIRLPAVAVQALGRQRQQQREARLRAGSTWSTTHGDLVFSDPDGTPIKSANASKRWANFAASAGLPPVTLHSLRHSAASLLAAQGESLFNVSRTLGHSNIATTSDLYSDMFSEARDRVADAMDRALTTT